MKRYLPKITVILVLVLSVLVLSGHAAHANALGDAAKSFVGGILDFTFGSVLQLFSYAIYIVLTIASFGLTVAAALLNVCIYFTTDLGVFINNTPAIYSVWQVLRDLSMMIFIFLLLWAGMQTILDLKGANYGKLLKDIVVVGICINFSFFFTTLLIDASNLVSLQLYNAIAPQTSGISCANTATGSNTYLSCIVGSVITNGKGGLADIIVQKLDVSQWWGNSSALRNANGSTEISIGIRMILVNSAAIVVTVLAALSFVAAAAAAIWRICVLVLLLAFSPLWIVGYALPAVKSEVSDKWWKHLRANLIFLPVYLLLMYVVLNIIQSMKLDTLGVTASAVGASGAGNWYGPYLELFIGFSIVIFMINIPLVTALSFSGAAGSWLETATNGTRAWFGRRTVGRAAYSVGQSKAMGWVASRSPALGQFASTGLSKISGNDWGLKKGKGSYEAVLKSKKKDQEAMSKRLGEMDKRLGRKGEESYQAAYRENLPWKSSVMGFMLDNRANKETQEKLNKDARSKELKGQKGKIKDSIADGKTKISELESEIKDQERDIGLHRGTPATVEQKAKLKALKDQLEKDNKTLDEIEEIQENERIDRMAGQVADRSKAEGGDKEKEEPKPKT